MGTYLILNAPSVDEAADYIGEPPLTATWERFGADVLFTDTALSDAECAALYAGYTPSGSTTYIKPLPDRWRLHLGHLRDYRAAVRDGQTPTTAQTQHALADLIDLVALVFPRVDTD